MLAAAFAVALALILVQIAFSRLISYKLFYHYVFLAISLSLLGLGAAVLIGDIDPEQTDVGQLLQLFSRVLASAVALCSSRGEHPFGEITCGPLNERLLFG